MPTRILHESARMNRLGHLQRYRGPAEEKAKVCFSVPSVLSAFSAPGLFVRVRAEFVEIRVLFVFPLFLFDHSDFGLDSDFGFQFPDFLCPLRRQPRAAPRFPSRKSSDSSSEHWPFCARRFPSVSSRHNRAYAARSGAQASRSGASENVRREPITSEMPASLAAS